jgi:hypothetical protein
MVNIVVIDKHGKATQLSTRDATPENLYKKVGMRTPQSFSRRVTWKVQSEGNAIYVSLYAKDDGKAGQENKMELPPPIDKDLYFGKLAIVATRDVTLGDPVDFPLTMWQVVHDKLFGGFEDLGAYDDETESDDDIPPEMATKHGYLKDGFVVDTCSSGDAAESDCEETDSYADSELSADEYESEASVELFTSNS